MGAVCRGCGIRQGFAGNPGVERYGACQGRIAVVRLACPKGDGLGGDDQGAGGVTCRSDQIGRRGAAKQGNGNIRIGTRILEAGHCGAVVTEVVVSSIDQSRRPGKGQGKQAAQQPIRAVVGQGGDGREKIRDRGERRDRARDRDRQVVPQRLMSGLPFRPVVLNAVGRTGGVRADKGGIHARARMPEGGRGARRHGRGVVQRRQERHQHGRSATFVDAPHLRRCTRCAAGTDAPAAERAGGGQLASRPGIGVSGEGRVDG